MTTLQDIIRLAKIIYEEMEANRLGATASKLVQTFTMSAVQPYSTKAGKFDALIGAKENSMAIRTALDALKKDPEFNSSTSLKNIVMILDHLIAAAMNSYADKVGIEARASHSPLEVALEAIQALTPAYHEQFSNVAQRAELLILAQRKLTECAIAEIQKEKQERDMHLRRAATTNTELVTQLNALHQTHQREFTHVQTELEETKAQLATMKTSTATEIKNLDANLTTVRQKALALNEKNQTLQRKNEELIQELAKLANVQSHLAAKTEHASMLQSQIDTLTGAYETERARNETLGHEIHSLQRRLNEARLQNSAKSLQSSKKDPHKHTKHSNSHDDHNTKHGYSK